MSRTILAETEVFQEYLRDGFLHNVMCIQRIYQGDRTYWEVQQNLEL